MAARECAHELMVAARAEAIRRVQRRDARARDISELAAIDEQTATIQQLLAVGMPIAGTALRLELKRLDEERTRLKIAIHSTSTMNWGIGDVRARDGEGTTETIWRVLLDRGATGYQIATLAGDTKDSALRKRMDRWRDELRTELLTWRDELRATIAPWDRTFELLSAVDRMLERLG
jgi:hypothetical protein